MGVLRGVLLAGGLTLAMACPAATIVIDGGAGFNDTTPATPEGGNTGTTRGQQRTIVFERAAEIWGARLESSQTITVAAEFGSLFCESGSAVVGSAGPNGFRTFSSPPPPGALAGYWYPVPLLEALANTNFNLADAEIWAEFNADIDNGCLGGGSRWWYGIDPGVTPPSGAIALLPVVLHELGHGLGFISLVCAREEGCGTCVEQKLDEGCGDGIAHGETIPMGARARGIDDIWGYYLYDKTLGMYWDDPAMTVAQRGDSVTNTGNLQWSGTEVFDERLAHQPTATGWDPVTGLMRMYAPDPAESGSSVSHWAREASPNLLMEPVLEADVFDGPDLTVALFRDMGWQTSASGGGPDDIFGNGFEGN